MMCEPLMLIIAFFIFFMFAFIYVRLDFSISKDEGQEVRLKVAGFCEKICGLQVRTNFKQFGTYKKLVVYLVVFYDALN